VLHYSKQIYFLNTLIHQKIFWMIRLFYFKISLTCHQSKNNLSYNSTYKSSVIATFLLFDIVGIIIGTCVFYLTFVMYNFLLPRIKYDIFYNYVKSICISFWLNCFNYSYTHTDIHKIQMKRCSNLIIVMSNRFICIVWCLIVRPYNPCKYVI